MKYDKSFAVLYMIKTLRWNLSNAEKTILKQILITCKRIFMGAIITTTIITL